ncbi:hypothetical protein SAY86_001447 [Trapa natans]|uniref:Uncharacterized protein n=1 Tax=Trapa natans TaxID=22666 RepID=A0AAN7MCR0_TRANT|nr:hypothetical protein SAY86_001447 [Trapa natans]
MTPAHALTKIDPDSMQKRAACSKKLRIKENQAQVLRYAKGLGLIEQDSHSQLDEYSPVEKLGSKSLQFSRQGSNRKIMIHEEEEEEEE